MSRKFYLKELLFTSSSLSFISKYDLKNHHVWDEKSTDMKNIKSELKTHYLLMQGKLCIYCRIDQVSDNHMVWDGEHILPKSLYPQFLFHTRNIALACKKCNRAKHFDDVLKENISRPVSTYPLNSDAYIIIHPHLDHYSQHMKIEKLNKKYLYIPLSKKGKETYRLCNLKRFAISEALNIKDDHIIDGVVRLMLELQRKGESKVLKGHTVEDIRLLASELKNANSFVHTEVCTDFLVE